MAEKGHVFSHLVTEEDLSEERNLVGTPEIVNVNGCDRSWVSGGWNKTNSIQQPDCSYNRRFYGPFPGAGRVHHAHET